MRDGDVDRVLNVHHVRPERLPLHLLDRSIVVVSRPQIPGREIQLRFARLRIRIGRAEHGPVLPDQHSTLRPCLWRWYEERNRHQGGDGDHPGRLHEILWQARNR